MPTGPEFQVNTTSSNTQDDAQITVLTDGGWVITWESNNQDGDGLGIYAQAYNSDGTTRGGEVKVNTFTTSSQQQQKIAALSDGGWVITWTSFNQDGDSNGVFGQAYNADGSAQGGEFQVNTYTTSFQNTQQIAALSDGGWVITWASDGQDSDSSSGVYAQAYNADGSLQGGEVQVNTYTTSNQGAQQITGLSDGGWVITWNSFAQDGGNFGVYAQAYNADGTPQGGEVQVNTFTTSIQYKHQIVSLSDGRWVITWISALQDGNSNGVFAQAYNADGSPQGTEFQVNTYTTGSQTDPQIAALDDGGWVITWSSYNQDGSLNGVYAQAYAADGTPQSGELAVNTFTANDQDKMQIAALDDGRWVITWESAAQDAGGSGIYAKVFQRLSDDDITIDLTGVQEVGETLTATVTGANVNNDTLTFIYSWSVDSTVVATTYVPSFTLLPEHAGLEVSVTVAILDSVFENAVGATTTSDPIFDGNDAPVGDVIFEVTDGLGGALGDQDALESIEIGYTFSIDEFIIQDLDGADEVSYQFQWLRSGEVIVGETGAQYTIAAEDEGHKIRLTISYTDDNGFDNTFLSETLKVAGLTGEFILGTESDEQMLGSSFNDVIAGLDGKDTLVGFKGGDVLIGGKGADVLTGNRGGDGLSGGKGNDLLLGGAGDDRLEGGKGNDVMTGGTGADRFIFKDGFGEDAITDFEAGVDQLVFKNVVFGPGTTVSSNDGNATLTIGDNVLIVEDASLADVNYFGLPI